VAFGAGRVAIINLCEIHVKFMVVVVEMVVGELLAVVVTIMVVVVVVVVVVVLVVTVVVAAVRGGPLHCSCGQFSSSLLLEVWNEWEGDSLPQNGCSDTNLISLAVKWTTVSYNCTNRHFPLTLCFCSQIFLFLSSLRRQTIQHYTVLFVSRLQT
jgi:hypothetical protein